MGSTRVELLTLSGVALVFLGLSNVIDTTSLLATLTMSTLFLGVSVLILDVTYQTIAPKVTVIVKSADSPQVLIPLMGLTNAFMMQILGESFENQKVLWAFLALIAGLFGLAGVLLAHKRLKILGCLLHLLIPIALVAGLFVSSNQPSPEALVRSLTSPQWIAVAAILSLTLVIVWLSATIEDRGGGAQHA